MGAVVAVGRVRHVAAGIADAGRDDAGQLADQVLHAPEAATGQNSSLGNSALGHLRYPPPGRDRRHSPRSPFGRSEEHTSELQSLMRISYAVFCLKKKKPHIYNTYH